MALQSNAALLDELMGKNRNLAPGASIRDARFDDEDTCKYFLVAFCPHDLFVNTRADLGPCLKTHDEEMKKQYEKSSRYGKLGYEEDFERYVRSLLNDVERKIRRGMERLKLTQTAEGETPSVKTPIQMKRERLAVLKEQVNDLIKEAERLGEEGNIDEAQAKLEESEKIKTECRYLENQLDIALHNAEQKQMEVCNVCGSFLIVNDAQSRIEEHVSGKQHVGYAKLRQALEDIRKKRIEELEKREKEREREKERDRDRDRDRDRRDRDRRRNSRERDSKRNGSLTLQPSRERERERDRDRDRERHHSNSHHSSSSKKRSSRSRSRSPRDSRSKIVKKESVASPSYKSATGSSSSSNLKLEQEADEFLKMVDDLTGKRKEKEKPSRRDKEEREEGEEDDDDVDHARKPTSSFNGKAESAKSNNETNNDDDMDEGEIRGA